MPDIASTTIASRQPIISSLSCQACPDGTPVTPQFVVGAYYQLFQTEKSFQMPKSDLQVRPVYHR